MPKAIVILSAALFFTLLAGAARTNGAPAVPQPARATMVPGSPQPTLDIVVMPQETTPGNLVRISIAVRDGDGRPGTVRMWVVGAARWRMRSTGACAGATCQVSPPGMIWIDATTGTSPLTIDATLTNADGVLVAAVHGRVQVVVVPTPTPRGSRVYLPWIQR